MGIPAGLTKKDLNRVQSLYKTWKVHGLMFYQAEEVFFFCMFVHLDIRVNEL